MVTVIAPQSPTTAGLRTPSSSHRGCEVLAPSGVIDSSSVWVFRQAVADLPQGAPVVVDLHAVAFIDSAGLGALIGAIRRVRQLGGDLNLAAPRPSIKRVLSTTGLNRLADIYNDIDQAAAAHHSPRAAAHSRR
jgi:anti-sigma B factor antagonist